MKTQLTFVAVLFLAACLESYGVNADEIVRAECLEPKQSECEYNYKRYYYDPAEKQCKEFVFGGCNANENNFLSLESCQEFCQTSPEKVCKQPLNRGEGLSLIPRFHYNSAEKKCLQFYYGGYKANLNNFRSEENCNNFCAGV